MKIGEYIVSKVTRDSARVGCQKVTRSQVQELLKEMDAVPEFQLQVGSPSDNDKPGSVWVEIISGRPVIKLRGKDNYPYNILSIDKDGIRLIGGCDGCGVATDGSSETCNALKIVDVG